MPGARQEAPMSQSTRWGAVWTQSTATSTTSPQLRAPSAFRDRGLADFFRELCDEVQLLLAFVVVECHRRDDQRVDSRVAEGAGALFRALRRAGDAHGVDQVVG